MTASQESQGKLRQAISLSPADALLFIYQDVLSPGRGIEVMLEAFSTIGDTSHLVFMGYGPLT
jgi:hypothetical protein